MDDHERPNKAVKTDSTSQTEAEKSRSTSQTEPEKADSNSEYELLKLEFAKVVDEIKFKIQLQDTWYNYKYLFIGAMLAILLGQAGLLKYMDETSSNQNIKSLKEIFTSGLVYLTVTFACVICVMIDMHIRRHMIDIQSLGLWIYYYAEPGFMGSIPGKSQFVPWESYLRLPVTGDSQNFLGNLANNAHTIALSTQLHFLSAMAYLLYTVIFQQMCLDFKDWKNSLTKNMSITQENIEELAQSKKMIIIFGFVMIHLTTLVLNLVIHSVSPRFSMQLFPYTNWYSYGWGSFLYYCIFWAATVLLSGLYLGFIWEKAPKGQTAKAVSTPAPKPATPVKKTPGNP